VVTIKVVVAYPYRVFGSMITRRILKNLPMSRAVTSLRRALNMTFSGHAVARMWRSLYYCTSNNTSSVDCTDFWLSIEYDLFDIPGLTKVLIATFRSQTFTHNPARPLPLPSNNPTNPRPRPIPHFAFSNISPPTSGYMYNRFWPYHPHARSQRYGCGGVFWVGRGGVSGERDSLCASGGAEYCSAGVPS
jgi:hypothetical protein